MVAPVVESEIVTVCAEVKVPAAGETVGVAAAGALIVYVAVATALFVYPLAAAMALMVSVEDTVIAAVYIVELVVGVVPSVV